jgi:succinate-semialdehyde dehydrogenase / glutarate-semialdehyde dehydrogenase
VTNDKLFIDGAWSAAEGERTFTVRNPATRSVLSVVADASAADGLRALDAAVAAAAPWASTSPRVRSEFLRRIHDLVIEHGEQIAMLITLEMGKPLDESRAEVAYGADYLRWFAEEAVRISGRVMPAPNGSGTMLVTHRPVGPSYLITPWNFPLAMATRKIGPALAAGCTVVIKPAELTPLTTLYLAGLVERAGVPSGVVNVITTTDAAGVSDAIIADDRLRKISFTGSTAVGKHLMKQAAEHVLRVSMELGGNAPFIVFDDADLDAAVESAMDAKFRNIGQACTAANRFLVQRGIADRFADRLEKRIGELRVGPGTMPDVTVGPLIDERAVSKIERLVSAAVADGASLVAGGHRLPGPGSFFAPTLLRGVGSSSPLCTEEIFGPVLPIVEFDSEEQAVRIANDTPYGLASYVFTESQSSVQRLIEHLDTGMMGVNVGVISDPAAPFGGTKQSGIGREGGSEGIHEYLTTKYTLLRQA